MDHVNRSIVDSDLDGPSALPTEVDQSPLIEEYRSSFSRGGWRAVIDDAWKSNRENQSGQRERELLLLREQAFSNANPARRSRITPNPALALPIDPDIGLPVLRGTLDPEVIRATILAHGCVMVPGLLSNGIMGPLRASVEKALAVQDAIKAGEHPAGAADWCSEYPRLRDAFARALASGILAVDTPHGLSSYLGALEDAGVLEMVNGYFGGPVAFSAEKTVFRRTDDVPPRGYGWHQDGSFLGGERITTLDIWITLTPSGITAPGLEILPRRVDDIIPAAQPGHWMLEHPDIEKRYPGFTTVIPEFAPGDGMFFDQLCVHRTGSRELTTKDTRISIECWMFAPDSVPDTYTGFLL